MNGTEAALRDKARNDANRADPAGHGFAKAAAVAAGLGSKREIRIYQQEYNEALRERNRRTRPR